MIGDNIELKPKYIQTAQAICELIAIQPKCCIAVAGESGSGKSVTAVALQYVLAQQGISSAILHQDDYFRYPPSTNHQKRLDDFEHIGPAEVNLSLMNAHIQAFKQGNSSLQKPLVHYAENQILSEELPLAGIAVLLVEGTYALHLEGLDVRIFMCRDYHQTLENRQNRGRDVMDDFTERVLQREHECIAPMKTKAHIWVQNDYTVSKR